MGVANSKHIYRFADFVEGTNGDAQSLGSLGSQDSADAEDQGADALQKELRRIHKLADTKDYFKMQMAKYEVKFAYYAKKDIIPSRENVSDFIKGKDKFKTELDIFKEESEQGTVKCLYPDDPGNSDKNKNMQNLKDFFQLNGPEFYYLTKAEFEKIKTEAGAKKATDAADAAGATKGDAGAPKGDAGAPKGNAGAAVAPKGNAGVHKGGSPEYNMVGGGSPPADKMTDDDKKIYDKVICANIVAAIRTKCKRIITGYILDTNVFSKTGAEKTKKASLVGESDDEGQSKLKKDMKSEAVEKPEGEEEKKGGSGSDGGSDGEGGGSDSQSGGSDGDGGSDGEGGGSDSQSGGSDGDGGSDRDGGGIDSLSGGSDGGSDGDGGGIDSQSGGSDGDGGSDGGSDGDGGGSEVEGGGSDGGGIDGGGSDGEGGGIDGGGIDGGGSDGEGGGSDGGGGSDVEGGGSDGGSQGGSNRGKRFKEFIGKASAEEKAQNQAERQYKIDKKEKYADYEQKKEAFLTDTKADEFPFTKFVNENCKNLLKMVYYQKGVPLKWVNKSEPAAKTELIEAITKSINDFVPGAAPAGATDATAGATGATDVKKDATAGATDDKAGAKADATADDTKKGGMSGGGKKITIKKKNKRSKKKTRKTPKCINIHINVGNDNIIDNDSSSSSSSSDCSDDDTNS